MAALLAAQAPGASVQGLGEGWVGEEALAVGLHAALGPEALPAGWGEGLDCAVELSELARQFA